MLRFESTNPFPLLPQDSCTYVEAQRQSAEVDDWLGLRITLTENAISNLVRAEAESVKTSIDSPHRCQHLYQNADQNLWIGLPPQTLLTPYTELRFILSLLDLRESQTVIDLGAAYGRMGFVIDRHHPGVKFLGYEVVAERVLEAQRCMQSWKVSPLIQICQADLSASSFKPDFAEFYFMYDFGSRRAIRKILDDLKLISQSKKICVVARGRAARDAIERSEPWLSQVQRPQHHAHFSIYRS